MAKKKRHSNDNVIVTIFHYCLTARQILKKQKRSVKERDAPENHQPLHADCVTLLIARVSKVLKNTSRAARARYSDACFHTYSYIYPLQFWPQQSGIFRARTGVQRSAMCANLPLAPDRYCRETVLAVANALAMALSFLEPLDFFATIALPRLTQNRHHTFIIREIC